MAQVVRTVQRRAKRFWITDCSFDWPYRLMSAWDNQKPPPLTPQESSVATHCLRLKHVILAIVLVACVSVPHIAQARCISYDPALGAVRLWAVGGPYGFRLTKPPGQRPPVGRLFRLSPAGQEQTVWERTLANIPNLVLFSSDLRTIATVDSACSGDRKHALVLYGSDGRVVADYAFDDIVPEKQWPGRVVVSSAGIYWSEGTQFTFEPDFSLRHFVITFPAGDQIRIDYTTGRVLAGDGLEVRPGPK